MNKLLRLLICFLISSYSASAQVVPPAWNFAKTFGSSNYETCEGMATDQYGNIYVCGGFQHPINFGNNITLTPQTNQIANLTGYIAKYSPQGDILWAKKHTGPGGARYGGITIDSTGNIYLVGNFHNVITFGTVSTPFATGTSEIFVAKLDPNGNGIWAKRAYGQSAIDRGYDITLDSSKNVFITGYFNEGGSVGATISFNNIICTSYGERDIFIFKLDSLGDAIWGYSAGTGPTSDDEGRDLAIDKQGNCYLTGTVALNGTTVAKPAHFGQTTITITSGEPFLAKFDPAGNVQWVRTPGTTKNDNSNALGLDKNGNAIIGENDLFYYSPSGILTHSLSPDSGQIMYVSAIAVDSASNYYISGDFPNSNGLSFNGSDSMTYHGGPSDAFLIKFDTTDQVVWSKSMGGTGHDRAIELVLDPAGNAIVSGEYNTGQFTTPPAYFDSLTIVPFGVKDVFVAKVGDNPLPIVTGLPREVLKESLPLYPNPFQSSFTLQLPISNYVNPQLTLQNTLGQTVWEKQQMLVGPNGILEVKINTLLPTGIYLLTIKQGEHVQHLKVIKE